MANHKSAIKRARQNEKRRERNTALRSSTKSAVKKVIEDLSSCKNREEALKILTAGARALSKAASKGVLPKTRVSRKISRIAAQVNKKFPTSSARA